MTVQALENIPTKSLNNRKKLAGFALYAVWLGASFAIGAALYRFFTDGLIPIRTIETSLMALVVSIPVYRERKRILAELEKRGKENKGNPFLIS